MAAKTSETPAVLFNSPTLSAGIEVPTNNGTVQHAVTFGRDSYERGFHGRQNDPAPVRKRVKVVCCGNAQPFGVNQEYRDKGGLVYTVDAAVATGKRPVSVVSGLDESPNADETSK